jgi:hypothetical protein
MASLLNAAKYLVSEYGFSPIYLNEPMFPDPIIPASQSELFQSLHTLMCAATGEDPAFVSIRRVVDWVAQKGVSAHA